MARRPNVTMRKRQREQRKAEKAEEKRARRLARADAKVDSDALNVSTETEELSGVEPSVDQGADPGPAVEELPSQPSVSAYCAVCNAVLDHTIVAQKADSISRVKCTACGDEHAHRTAKPIPRKKARKTKQAKDDSYDSLIAGLDPAEASPYDMTSVYEHHNLIAHPAFGIGVVARILPDRKIEVLFPEGARVLAHSR